MKYDLKKHANPGKIKFFIDQHGCAKNQVDGELICSKLMERGYELTFDAEAADLIIINSCGFIESAKKESLDAVYSAKQQNGKAKILLAGCLAERYADTLASELPEADGIFGNGDVSKIDEIAGSLFAAQFKKVGAPVPRQDTIGKVLRTQQKGVSAGKRTLFLSHRGSAFVKVTEGCSNHCTFCAIPLIRGELRSRPADEIVAEIKDLVAQGFYEINLIGQDMAAYGTGESDNVLGFGRCKLPTLDENGVNCGTAEKSALAHLLERISALDGFFRLRLLYIHPDHFNRDILQIISNDERIVPYFDIPFQSGTDKIIWAMNRKGSAQEYIRLVRDIRTALPEAAIRTTFLTGFPGESDDDAETTKAFLKNIQSDWSGCFAYSREEDTPAYNMKNRVSQKAAKSRAADLQKLQAEITAARLAERAGKEYDVIIEEIVSLENHAENEETEEPSFAITRAWFQAPEVDGNVVVRFDRDDKNAVLAMRPGNVIRVFADRVNGVDLEARFVQAVKIYAESELHFAPEEA